MLGVLDLDWWDVIAALDEWHTALFLDRDGVRGNSDGVISSNRFQQPGMCLATKNTECNASHV